MQEIFNQVLSKEEEAARIIKEARDKALEIGAEAEKNYQDRLRTAREKSREKLNRGKEEIRREQEAKVHAFLKDYDKKWVELQEKGQEKIDMLAFKLADITASPI